MARKKSRNSRASGPPASEVAPRKKRPARRAGPRVAFEAPIPRALWWIVGLAALFRIPFIGWFGYWLDEVYIRQNVLDTFAQNLNTVHFIHFLVIKPFLGIADHEFLLRLPSALFGLGTVVLGFLTARRLFNERAGLLYAAFIAIGTYFINYSIDANYYSHMMFWVLAAIYCFARLISTHQILNLLPIAAIAPLCFFVHPFSALFFATFLGFVFLHLVTTPKYFEGLPFYDLVYGNWVRRIVFLLLLVIAPVAVVIAISGGAALKQFLYLSNLFLEMVSLGQSPTNIEFGYGFFEEYFRRIGPAFFTRLPATLWTDIGTYLLFAAFLFGTALSARRDPLLPVLFLVPFALSFGVIFNLAANRFFSIRYFSYLVPLYWLAIAVAVSWGIDRLLSKRPEQDRPRLWNRAAAGAIAGVAALSLTHLWFVFSIGGRSWDGIMPTLAAEANPGGRLIYTNWAEDDMMPYYFKKYGLNDIEPQRLNFRNTRGKHALSELKDLASRGEGFWFLSSWLDIRSREAVAWAREVMEETAEGPSFFGPSNDARLYRWTMAGRFVLPPRILRYEPEAHDAGTSFEEEFLFDRAMEYEFRVRLAEGGSAPGLELAVGGRTVPLLTGGEAGDAFLGTRLNVPRGLNELRLATTGAPFQVASIQIIPRYEGGAISMPGWEASEVHPSDYTWIVEEAGGPVLVQKRSTYSVHDFGLAESGNYWIGVEAKHDRPVAILIEVRIDGNAAGILHWDRGDETYQLRGFPYPLEAGDHQIELRFVNEGDVSLTEPDEDKDAFIRELQVIALAEGRPGRSDLFFPPTGEPLSPDAIKFPFADEGAGNTLNMDWEYVADLNENFRPQVVDDPELGEQVLRAVVPREYNGFYLVGPKIRIREEGQKYADWIYYSALLRVEDLENHSVNLLTKFLGRNGESLTSIDAISGGTFPAEREVNAEGFNKTTGWIRIVCFGRVPRDDIYAYQPTFIVYSNGKKTSDKIGKVYFADMRLENR